MPGMSRRRWRGALIGCCLAVLLSTFVVELAGPTPRASAASPIQDGYYYGGSPSDGNNAHRPDWMSLVDPTRHLSELTIPGTHDSGTYYTPDPGTQTQTMDIPTQLEVGIRALDIRLGGWANPGSCPVPNAPVDPATGDINGAGQQLHVMHVSKLGDFGYAGECEVQSFDDVLNQVFTFLGAHQKETVLMRVDDATSANVPDTSADPAFGALVAEALMRVKQAASYFKLYNSCNLPVAGCSLTANAPASDATNPTLAEMQGSLVILQDFHTPTTFSYPTLGTKWYGIPYPQFDGDQGWHLEDNYSLSTIYNIADKWGGNGPSNSVYDALGRAAAADPTQWKSMTYLSAAGGAFPYSFASGKYQRFNDGDQILTPWDDNCDLDSGQCLGDYYHYGGWSYFKGLNQLTLDILTGATNDRSLVNVEKLGIVFADFPGPGICSAHADTICGVDPLAVKSGLIGTLISYNQNPIPVPPLISFDFADMSGHPLPSNSIATGVPFQIDVSVKNDNGLIPGTPSESLSHMVVDLENLFPIPFSEGQINDCGLLFGSYEYHGGSLPAGVSCNLNLIVPNGMPPELGEPKGFSRGVGPISVTATASDGRTLSSSSGTQHLYPGTQAITWNPSDGGVVPVQHLGSNFYFLEAQGGGSGLPVVFSVDGATTNNACSLGNQGPALASPLPVVYGVFVKLNNGGACVIDADQAGTNPGLTDTPGTYLPAPRATVSIPVLLYSQDITFTNNPINPNVYLSSVSRVAPTITTTATATSNGPVTLSVDLSQTVNNACTLNGNVITFTNQGFCAIDAKQPGTPFWLPVAATEVFSVRQSPGAVPQNLGLTDPETAVSLDLPIESTIGGSGRPVVFYVDAGKSTTNACTLGQQQRTTDPTTGKPVYKVTVHPVHAGLCVVDAFEDGNSKYDFGFASTGITVDTGNQGVTFTNTIPSPAAIGESFRATATGGGSGNPVIFSVDATTTNGACSLGSDGVTVTLQNFGTCVIDAHQDGNADYHPGANSESIPVTLQGAAAQLADLEAAVTGVGPGSVLARTVLAAQSLLAANHVEATCIALNFLVFEVKFFEWVRVVTPGAGSPLIATAQRIEAVLACGDPHSHEDGLFAHD